MFLTSVLIIQLIPSFDNLIDDNPQNHLSQNNYLNFE